MQGAVASKAISIHNCWHRSIHICRLLPWLLTAQLHPALQMGASRTAQLPIILWPRFRAPPLQCSAEVEADAGALVTGKHPFQLRHVCMLIGAADLDANRHQISIHAR